MLQLAPTYINDYRAMPSWSKQWREKAQLDLAKVRVAGSNPVVRSKIGSDLGERVGDGPPRRLLKQGRDHNPRPKTGRDHNPERLSHGGNRPHRPRPRRLPRRGRLATLHPRGGPQRLDPLARLAHGPGRQGARRRPQRPPGLPGGARGRRQGPVHPQEGVAGRRGLLPLGRHPGPPRRRPPRRRPHGHRAPAQGVGQAHHPPGP